MFVYRGKPVVKIEGEYFQKLHNVETSALIEVKEITVINSEIESVAEDKDNLITSYQIRDKGTVDVDHKKMVLSVNNPESKVFYVKQ